jgi:hypothetical protein
MDLTPEETAQILKQRQACVPKLDEQRSELLADLDELNGQGRAAGYGPLPRGIDAETVALIKKIQEVGYRMKTAPYGDARPFAVPTRVAHEIIKAVRGEVQPKAAPSGFKVPT